MYLNGLCLDSSCSRSHPPDSSVVAGQLGLKSSRPLSQVGPVSTRPESTRPDVSQSLQLHTCTCILYTFWVLQKAVARGTDPYP